MNANTEGTHQGSSTAESLGSELSHLTDHGVPSTAVLPRGWSKHGDPHGHAALAPGELTLLTADFVDEVWRREKDPTVDQTGKMFGGVSIKFA